MFIVFVFCVICVVVYTNHLILKDGPNWRGEDLPGSGTVDPGSGTLQGVGAVHPGSEAVYTGFGAMAKFAQEQWMPSWTSFRRKMKKNVWG